MKATLRGTPDGNLKDEGSRNVKEYKDEDLVALSLEGMGTPGDNKAFEELVIRHYEPVKKAIRAKMGALRDLDDIAQSSFMKAYYSLHNLRDPSKFRYWVRMIAINEAAGSLREQQPNISVEDALIYPEYAKVRGPYEKAEAALLLDKLKTELPGKYMQVLYLRYYLEYTVKETAELLGIGQGLVKWRAHQAKLLAQQVLEGKQTERK